MNKLYVPSVLSHCWLGGRKGIQPVKNSPDRGLRSSPHLDLTSDDLESHIVVNVSSTSNIVPSLVLIAQVVLLLQYRHTIHKITDATENQSTANLGNKRQRSNEAVKQYP